MWSKNTRQGRTKNSLFWQLLPWYELQRVWSICHMLHLWSKVQPLNHRGETTKDLLVWQLWIPPLHPYRISYLFHVRIWHILVRHKWKLSSYKTSPYITSYIILVRIYYLSISWQTKPRGSFLCDRHSFLDREEKTLLKFLDRKECRAKIWGH